MSKTITTIDKLQKFVDNMDSVYPGKALRFTQACQPGDCIWQGDLGFVIIDSIPKSFVRPKEPTIQLVKGTTQGSKHALDSLDGVTLLVPQEWTDESLIGPAFTTHKEVNVLHPTHGTVTIPEGMTIQCVYQRVWDKEQAKERRQRD